MFFSHKAMMSSSGVSLPLDAIRQLQIDDGSPCWGMWLRYWDKNDGQKTRDDYPSHLVVCPFHPSTWPCLLHVSLKLEDRSGSVFDALSALSKCGVSVLSIVCAPSGHNHETMDLVGTIPSILESREMESLQKIISVNASIDDLNRQREITNAWAEPVLLRVEKVKKDFKDVDKAKQFLRKRYKNRTVALEETSGIAFNPYYLTEETWGAIGESHGLEAVKISWLQHPAFYRYHGEPSYIEMAPSTERRNIQPVVKFCTNYREHLPSILANSPNAVIPVLASVDAMSRFVRFMPMRHNEKQPCEVEIAVTHKNPKVSRKDLSPAGEAKSSLGVLASLAKAVCKAEGNLSHLSNSISMKDSSKESSKIRLIVTDNRGTINRYPHLLEILRDALDPSELKNLPTGSIVHPPSVCRFDCLNLFVSKRNGWWEKSSFGKKCATTTRHEILKCGYKALEDPPIDGIGGESTSPGIIEMIRISHGMLAFIPAEDIKNNDNKLQWILWEMGVADGRRIPYRVIVECDHQSDQIARIESFMKMTKGKNYNIISDNDLQDEIPKIIQSLVNQIRINQGE